MENSTIKSSDVEREYRPSLSFYHAKPKGNGSVVKFELHPAHGTIQGSIFATFALQSPSTAPSGNAAFDWRNSIAVKLNVNDLALMLQVFRGMTESINGKEGLYHASTRATTIIRLTHRLEPTAGYCLSVSRKANGNSEGSFIGIFLSPTEALALSLAIEQSFAYMAFGVPRIVPRQQAIRPVALEAS